ncbi:MAG: dihydroneopterin aldolase [Actinomycetes bacterium]
MSGIDREDVLDRITLTGISAFGYHGVLPEERVNGQRFVVDVVLHLDLHPAGRTDDLAMTVDYSQVAQLIEDCVCGSPCDLIEALASRIAQRILDLDRVLIVEVTVHKPSAPIAQQFVDAAVTIVRGSGFRDGGNGGRHASANG